MNLSTFSFYHGIRRRRVPSALRCLWLIATAFVANVCGSAQTLPTQSPYYFAIENLDNGQVVRRGVTKTKGIPANTVILAPNTSYREWLLEGATSLIGFTEFKTPSTPELVKIPPIDLGLPKAGDSDGDGLTDDAEFVVGADPRNPDTDGDGIKDGAAVKLGLDAGGSRTGIIGSADTPGTAVDICAFNDIVVVADSERGISVFNVFNRMSPLIIAQVDTPGRATAVAGSGNLIAVADGPSGLAIIDFSDPPNAAIRQQFAIDGSAQAVATTGDLAFVGTGEGKVFFLEMSSGVVFQEVAAGGNVFDLGVSGDYLFVVAGGQLQSYRFTSGLLERTGQVALSSFGADGITQRRRIFVGPADAYVTSYPGYDTIDVRDPAAMRLVGSARDVGPNSVKQIVDNGNGLGVAAVGINPSDDGTHDVWLYRLTDPAVTTNFVTALPTPGIARAVSLYNGIAYVADGDAGLQVVNYLARDTQGKSPEGTLSTSAISELVSVGGQTFFRASVTDDVQMRNVEFYVDGVRAATDGNFPFEFAWRAPTDSVGKKFAFTAIASDTGGNTKTLNRIELTAVPDADPPAVVMDAPSEAQIFLVGDDIVVKLTMRDNVGIGAVEFKVNGQVVPVIRKSFNEWLLLASLSTGSHTVTVTVRDRSGLTTTSPPRQIQVLKEAISREVSVFNFGPPDVPEAISRETSVFNFGPEEKLEAISREISLFNFSGVLDTSEAISREVSLFNFGPIERAEGISREVSVQNKPVAQSQAPPSVSPPVRLQSPRRTAGRRP